MQSNTNSAMDQPGKFRIRVGGHLTESWVQSMWGDLSVIFVTADQGAETILEGEVADQAYLLGIVNALYNTGHPVIGLERVDRPDSPCAEGQEPAPSGEQAKNEEVPRK